MDDLTRIQTINRSPLALRSDKTGEVHPLSGEMLVGREVECEIQLAFRQISRYHAKLFVAANGVFVEDLKSSNGTSVNGRKIRARTQISVGDQVAFDDLTYRVTTPRASEEDQTRISTSQNFSPESIAEINKIAAEQLKPVAPPLGESVPAGRFAKESIAPTKDSAEHEQSGGKTDTPRVHEIPDMDEFLRFAGSGLKPQAPLPAKSSNPFGLHNKKAEIERREKSAEDALPVAPPLESGAYAVDIDKAAEAKGPDRSGLEKAEATVRPPNVPPPQQEASAADDDQTRYVSLNTMDRYIETNERYKQDLNVGSGPRLVAMTAPIRGKVFPLTSDDDVKCWSIGRDDSADICLRDKAISREHAWVTKLDAFYQLRVNESAGDILVNGQTITEAELTHGDRLQFGAMEIVFRLDAEPAKPSVPVEPPPTWWSRVKGLFYRGQD
ncbi:MAG: FHA domain-containing protein [Agarilytica sp.]